MTIKEFHEKLKTEVVTDYIVYLKYKYDFETEYTYSNEILVVDSHSDDLYAWLRDWNEGQTDVEVLGYISVWEVDVTKNNQGDLISRSALRKDIERLYSVYKDNKDYFYTDVLDHIDNALTVEVPENTVNCVLTMFGKCSYNETGCSDCEIKDKIHKALNDRPTGEWIPVSERLPDNETDVLICNMNGDVEIAKGSYSTEIADEFIWYTSGWRFGTVIAWMPLPKSYKEAE